MAIRSCIDWASESIDQCREYQTETDEICGDWDSRCCTWWPCNWACKVVTWICQAWNYVTTTFCVLWTVVVTSTCIAWSVAELVLTPVSFVIGLVAAIPFVGRAIQWVGNTVADIVHRVISIPEFAGTLAGLTLLKKLKISIIILRDEKGVALTTATAMQATIDAATTIYSNQCNIQLQVDGIYTVDSSSPTEALDVGCNIAAFGTDAWIGGSYFELTANWVAPLTNSGRKLHISPTIIVFIVRTVDGGPPDQTGGCAEWALTDYLTLEPDNICLAHELGHKCGLWHIDSATNLMNPICGNSQLEGYQKAIVRSSSYVSYA